MKPYAFLLALLAPILFHAQSTSEESIVRLHDGTTLIGDYSSNESGKAQVRLDDGQVVEFDKKDVQKHLAAHEVSLYDRGRFHFKKSLYLTTEVGLNPTDNGGVLFEFGVGKRVTPRLHVGGNFGAIYIQDYFASEIVDPWSSYSIYISSWFNQLSAHGKYVLREGPANLYSQLNVGYGFAHDNRGFYGSDEIAGGFMFRPSVGMNFASRSDTRFYTQLSWGFQQVDFERRDWNGFEYEDIRVQRMIDMFMFSFGVQFNAREF